MSDVDKRGLDRLDHPPREVRAPRGPELSCGSWQTEAPLRMLMNNLDPENAERPEDPAPTAICRPRWRP